MNPRPTFALLTCLFTLAGSLAAQDPQDLHRKTEALLQKADALAEQGQVKQAEALRDQARALHESADRSGKTDAQPSDLDLQIEKHMAGLRSLQEKLEDLNRTAGKDESAALMKQELAAEMSRLRQSMDELQAQRKRGSQATGPGHAIADREAALDKLRAALHEIDGNLDPEAGAPMRRQIEDKIAHVERELAELHGAQHQNEKPAHEHKQPEMAGRIGHILAAAEHVEAAGMPDLAAELRNRAKVMESELLQHQQGDDAAQELQAQVNDLQNEVRRLQAALEDLHALIRSTSDR